ncbi:MAG: alpha/beta hydrolase [Phycisphaerales bacterium]
MIGLLLIGLVIAATAAAGATLYRISHPPRRTYASAVARSRPGDPSELGPTEGGPRAFERWTFTSRGHILEAWEIPGDDPAGPTVILTHGWGDSKIGGLSRVGPLFALASRVVLWDMPGHGESSGTSTLGAAEPRDLLELIRKVADERPVVLAGWSMGATVSIRAACEESGVAAVIAESPYRHPATPAGNMLIASRLPYRFNLPVAMALLGVSSGVGPRWNRPEPFDVGASAARLRCPLLVLHGSEDRIVPLGEGRSIAGAAPSGRLLVIDGAGHDGLWTSPATRHLCAQAVTEFIRSALLPTTMPG